MGGDVGPPSEVGLEGLTPGPDRSFFEEFCVFCRIGRDCAERPWEGPEFDRRKIATPEFAVVWADWGDTFAIAPRNPVTEGHALVIPREHVAHLGIDPEVTGKTFERAADFAYYRFLSKGIAANLITSAGRHATQTVFHLHVHVVPRRRNDGLALPWSE